MVLKLYLKTHKKHLWDFPAKPLLSPFAVLQWKIELGSKEPTVKDLRELTHSTRLEF